MNKKLFKIELIGFVFVCVLGTLCHFFFEWSSYSRAVGLFCPVNESVWEHLKLLWFPYIFYTIFECVYFKCKNDILPSKLIGSVVGITTITAFFYTYTGIIGKSIMALDVASFFIGVIVAFFVDYILIKSNKFETKYSKIISALIIIFICALFFIFTFYPPKIHIFLDTGSMTYGI